MLSVEPWEIGKYWQTHLNTYIWFMGSVSIPIERIYLVWDVLERLFLIAEENAHLSAHGALLHVDEDFILAYAFLGGKRFQHAPDGFRFFQDILDIDLPRILRKNQIIQQHIWNRSLRNDPLCVSICFISTDFQRFPCFSALDWSRWRGEDDVVRAQLCNEVGRHLCCGCGVLPWGLDILFQDQSWRQTKVVDV